MKECNRCHNWCHEICVDFNCEIKSNEIINNIFVNLCFENEEMHSIIALVFKEWSRHINKESVQK